MEGIELIYYRQKEENKLLGRALFVLTYENTSSCYCVGRDLQDIITTLGISPSVAQLRVQGTRDEALRIGIPESELEVFARCGTCDYSTIENFDGDVFNFRISQETKDTHPEIYIASILASSYMKARGSDHNMDLKDVHDAMLPKNVRLENQEPS